ncbi:hypothetical protein BD309DRAFT_949991 [Dichomitus squalens]|nr:hypothetical protein BD309DRAFT_949991 [Dichomitus squalens]
MEESDSNIVFVPMMAPRRVGLLPRSMHSSPQIPPGSIPDDVLLEIASYLSPSDISSLSLVSKHFHSVISFTEGYCKELGDLSSFHRFLFGVPPNADSTDRARILRLRSVYLGAMHPSGDLESQEEREINTKRLMDIIREAKNLRYLRFRGIFDDFATSTRYIPQPVPTMHLQHLVHLHLENASDGFVLLDVLPQKLRILQLSNRDKLRGTIFPLRELVQSHVLPHLEVLILEDMVFEDEDPDDPDSADSNSDSRACPNADPWTTLQSLTISKTELGITFSCIAELFPNLRSLCMIDSEIVDDSHLDDEPFSLRKLTISGLWEDQCIPWTTSHLRCIHTDPRCSPVLDSLYCDSLAALTLRLPKLRSDLWDCIWDFMSDIRSIELECTEMDFPSMLQFMIEQCDTMDTSLWWDTRVLSLIAPEPKVRPSDGGRELESLRTDFLVKMSKTFRQLFDTRYVAFAQPKDVSPDYQEDYAGNNAPWSWWKIIKLDDDDAPTEIREIPAWEGERVRAYFREADVEAASKFEERFMALR